MYKGKHIAVLGLGIAGRYSARVLADVGAVVYAWDDSADARRQMPHHPNIHEVDLHHFDMHPLDFMVVSPGIADFHPICKRAIQHNIPLVGEVKLRYDMSPDATFVGITGTNGKSTTTALVAHILQSAGVSHAVGGNFGMPALALPHLGNGEVYVMEMSSYMLTRIQGMTFSVAGLLNVTPDHLAWHGDMDGYFNAKMRIFDNMSDGAVVCTDDAAGIKARDILQQRGCAVSCVSYNHMPPAPYLKGNHNRQNMAVAVAICEKLGIARADILAACTHFKGLQHRQQLVYADDTMTFVNDSKATNVQSAMIAMGCYHNIHWIAGGQEKDGGYEELIPYLHRISHAYLIGEGANNIAQFLRRHNIAYTISTHLQQAVSDAYQAVKVSGGVVLLSPACASWDQFDSFAQRGDMFCRCVQACVQGKKVGG